MICVGLPTARIYTSTAMFYFDFQILGLCGYVHHSHDVCVFDQCAMIRFWASKNSVVCDVWWVDINTFYFDHTVEFPPPPRPPPWCKRKGGKWARGCLLCLAKAGKGEGKSKELL